MIGDFLRMFIPEVSKEYSGQEKEFQISMSYSAIYNDAKHFAEKYSDQIKNKEIFNEINEKYKQILIYINYSKVGDHYQLDHPDAEKKLTEIVRYFGDLNKKLDEDKK